MDTNRGIWEDEEAFLGLFKWVAKESEHCHPPLFSRASECSCHIISSDEQRASDKQKKTPPAPSAPQTLASTTFALAPHAPLPQTPAPQTIACSLVHTGLYVRGRRCVPPVYATGCMCVCVWLCVCVCVCVLSDVEERARLDEERKRRGSVVGSLKGMLGNGKGKVYAEGLEPEA